MDQSDNTAEHSSELARVDKRRARPLEQGWVRARLIRDLAIGEIPQKTLAEEFGVVDSAITEFKKRHWVEIERVRDNMADQYGDMWISSKRSRLAELQKAAEKLAEKPDARSAEVLAKLLKDAAEELGDLPAKAQVQIMQQQVTYQIEGINLEDLR